MNNEPINPSNNSNNNRSIDVFDTALLDEPGYTLALDELLSAIEEGGSVYDRVARRYPRYAAPLLEAALTALPADRRLRAALAADQPAPVAVLTVMDAGIAAARKRLGIAAADALTLKQARQQRGWTLGELARRMRLNNRLAQIVHGGQIATWSAALRQTVADAFETTLETAEAMLAASSVAPRQTAGAAYAAENGDPQAAQVQANRSEQLDFDALLVDELNSGRLNPEQAAYWKRQETQ